ncbi:unnamed protein product, partial [Prorocentrum cordatum]
SRPRARARDGARSRPVARRRAGARSGPPAADATGPGQARGRRSSLVEEEEEEEKSTPQDRRQRHPLFALVSLNAKTAPNAEVCWSQLLALSLAPEDEPVLTVGRAAEQSLSLPDPRVSARHFEVVARRKAGTDLDEGRLPPGAVAYECFLKDCSSNGTHVNGSVVGRGNSRQIRSGDEISVLPASNVGEDEQVSFLFRNTTEVLAEAEEDRPLRELEDLVQCPICLQ